MNWLEDVLRIGKSNLDNKEIQRKTAARCKTSLRNVNLCIRITKLWMIDPKFWESLPSKRAAIRILIKKEKEIAL
jgi:hypothetical protein